jgi:hypothetical protein
MESHLSLNVSGKAASSSMVPHGERCPFPEPSFILLSKVPGKELPYRFPSGVLIERDALSQSFPLHTPQGPQHRSPLQVPLTELL